MIIKDKNFKRLANLVDKYLLKNILMNQPPSLVVIHISNGAGGIDLTWCSQRLAPSGLFFGTVLPIAQAPNGGWIPPLVTRFGVIP